MLTLSPVLLAALRHKTNCWHLSTVMEETAAFPRRQETSRVATLASRAGAGYPGAREVGTGGRG